MAYHVTIMKSNNGPDGNTAFFSDYINNPSKRYQDWTNAVLPEGYWPNYDMVYARNVANNQIIFRSKHVDANNMLHITQVWDSQESRTQFLADVDAPTFDNARTINVVYETYDTDNNGVASLVNTAMTSNNYVIQVCAPEFRVSEMRVGDPLKGDTVITVP